MDHLTLVEAKVFASTHWIDILDLQFLLAGWTPKTVPLVRQLTEANSTRGLKRSIVILGNRDKEEMDEELRIALPVSDRNGSKVRRVRFDFFDYWKGNECVQMSSIALLSGAV